MRSTHTPARSVRVPDDVWAAAKAEAERRGETVTAALVRFLRRYAKGPLLALLAVVLLAGCSSSRGGATPAQKAAASKSTAAAYDKVFLTSVRTVWPGIKPSLKIAVARAECASLDDGSTIAAELAQAQANGLTAEQSGTLLGAAVAVYCPSHAGTP